MKLNRYLNQLPKQTGNVLEIDQDINMNWVGVKDSWELVVGTSLMDAIDTDYWTLVSLFGQPEVVSGTTGDGKVQVQWVIKTPYGIATIYDWKEYVDPTKVTDWHIGGKDNLVSDFIINRIECYELAVEKAKEYADDAKGTKVF